MNATNVDLNHLVDLDLTEFDLDFPAPTRNSARITSESHTPSNANNISEVACPVCLEFFREPKSLSCGHSLCRDCVQTMIGRARISGAFNQPTLRIQCPSCRTHTVVPPNGLPTNYGLKTCNTGSRWFCSTCGVKYHNGHNLLGYTSLRENVTAEKERFQIVRQELNENIGSLKQFGDRINEVSLNIYQVLEEKTSQAVAALERKLKISGAGLITLGGLQSISAQRRQIRTLLVEVCEQVENSQQAALGTLQECLNNVLGDQRFVTGENEGEGEQAEADEESRPGTSSEVMQLFDEGSPSPSKRTFTLTEEFRNARELLAGASGGVSPDKVTISPRPSRQLAVPRRRVRGIGKHPRKFAYDETEDDQYQ